jgi:hypothetical protein
MLYRGYWIEFVDLTPFDPDGNFNALFLIRRRQSREILAEAPSIGQTLAVIRELIRDGARQTALNLGGVA